MVVLRTCGVFTLTQLPLGCATAVHPAQLGSCS